MSLSRPSSRSRTNSALRTSSAIVVIRSFAALSEASSCSSALSSASSRPIATSRLSAEHPTPPRTPCARPGPSRGGLGLRPIRDLLDRLGGFWGLLRGFKLGHPRGEGGVGLGQLRDDGVRPPPGLPFLGELPPQILGLLPQDLDQRSTVYLSFTSSLRPAVVQPHPDGPVLPVRTQGSPGDALPDGVRADAQLFRRRVYVQPPSRRAILHVQPPSGRASGVRIDPRG